MRRSLRAYYGDLEDACQGQKSACGNGAFSLAERAVYETKILAFQLTT
jgi:hypothetical protein